MEVITSKGTENVNDGYWVATKGDGKYHTVHVSESLKPYTWEEGIFETLKEAKQRVRYHEKTR